MAVLSAIVFNRKNGSSYKVTTEPSQEPEMTLLIID